MKTASEVCRWITQAHSVIITSNLSAGLIDSIAQKRSYKHYIKDYLVKRITRKRRALVEEICIIVLQLIIALTFIMFAWPSAALANAGLPMFALAWPGMFIALIPIIIIESWYLHKRLKVSFGRSTKVTTISNLISTIIGIPLAWIAMLMIEMAGGLLLSQFPSIGPFYENAFGAAIMTMVGAAWIAPDEKNIHRMLPMAFIVLMIPFFFVTWWIEYRSVKSQKKDIDPGEIKIVTRNKNLLSYGFLVMLLLIWLITELIRRHN